MRGPVRQGAGQKRRHNGNSAVAFCAGPGRVSPVASRRYCTTRPLDLQVTRALDQLGAATVGQPDHRDADGLLDGRRDPAGCALLTNNGGGQGVGGGYRVWRDTDRQRQRRSPHFQALGYRVALESMRNTSGFTFGTRSPELKLWAATYDL